MDTKELRRWLKDQGYVPIRCRKHLTLRGPGNHQISISPTFMGFRRIHKVIQEVLKHNNCKGDCETGQD
jgi:hypothetical protein